MTAVTQDHPVFQFFDPITPKSALNQNLRQIPNFIL